MVQGEVVVPGREKIMEERLQLCIRGVDRNVLARNVKCLLDVLVFRGTEIALEIVKQPLEMVQDFIYST